MSGEGRRKPGKPKQESIYKRKCLIYSINIYEKSAEYQAQFEAQYRLKQSKAFNKARNADREERNNLLYKQMSEHIIGQKVQ